jgi:acyl carrier protein
MRTFVSPGRIENVQQFMPAEISRDRLMQGSAWMDINDVKTWIRECLLRQNHTKMRNVEVRDNVNLVESGILDSLGFVSVIAAIESHFGILVDLVNLPVEDLVYVDSLANVVVKSLESSV